MKPAMAKPIAATKAAMAMMIWIFLDGVFIMITVVDDKKIIPPTPTDGEWREGTREKRLE